MRTRVLRPLLFVLVSCLLAMACDAVTGRVLDVRYTGDLTVTESRDASGVTLHVSGCSLHSAMVVSRCSEATRGDTLILQVHVVLTRDDGRTGTFQHDLRLPPGITRVVYGPDEEQIWPTPP